MNKLGVLLCVLLTLLAGCTSSRAHFRTANGSTDSATREQKKDCPNIHLNVDLAKERRLQGWVDQGHQTWRLDPIWVAVSEISKIESIHYDQCEILFENSSDAIVECRASCTYRVLLQKLVRPDGVWTAVEIRTVRPIKQQASY